VDSDKGGRLRITAVAPGSPAASAGVRRGETVRAIDGRPVSEADALGLTFGLPGPARQLDLEGPDGAVRTVRVGPANFTASPVPVETIVDGGGARVGYLGLDTFEPEAMRPFLSAAKRLAAAGIAELVVDLRRNMGGSVGVARVVAGAIGGEAVRGKTFAKLGHNDRYRDLDRDVEFAIPAAGALALKRVVVLTSSETCSASEALINGLRPYLAVITIGGRTCGKPVGSRLVDYRGTRYAVISFSVANARGEGNYVSGIPPTCAIEDNYARELGDPEETLLAAALAYLRTGRCPAPADGAAGQADGAAG
jgi:C-terminal processing protease CtpA/Prc